jgi:hypothetical protein
VLTTYPSATLLHGLYTAMYFLSIVVLISLLAAAALHKMIGLETLSVLQLCMAAPFLLGDLSVVFRVFEGLAFVNGFGGQLFYNFDNVEIYGNSFENMSLPKTFTESMLINGAILLSILTVFGMGCVTRCIFSC